MTSHELAKKLLEGPNLPVYTQDIPDDAPFNYSEPEIVEMRLEDDNEVSEKAIVIA